MAIDPNESYGITMSADDRESWEAYLEDFAKLIYPMFARIHTNVGQPPVTLGEALLLFELNKVNGRLTQVIEVLKGEDDAGKPY